MATGIPGLTASLRFEIGEKVRAKRIERRWHQQHLGDFAGLRKWTIGLIERGEYLPRLDTLYLLAVALDCDVSELLPEPEEVFRAYQIPGRFVRRAAAVEARPDAPGGGVAPAGQGDAR